MGELVSVVMPTYNCGRYIGASIRSVIEQTYVEWELLVVDDCSTDETERVVAAANDSRIRYFRNETNCGAAVSRNIALARARGRYVAFLDSDDMWLPNKLEHQIRFMQNNGYAFSYHEYEEVDEEGRPMGVHVGGVRHVGRLGMYACCWPGCLTVMYDTSVVGLVQIADIKKNNDSAMWFKVVQKADCYLLKEDLARYRRRRGSITPPSVGEKVHWHYLLFRQAEGMGTVSSVFWTIVNIVCNSIKKLFYVKHIDNKSFV